MIRDRLRRWRLNDKNRRGAANQRRKTLQLANNRSNDKNPSSRHATVYHSSLRPTMPNHGNLQNVLHTSKEILILQRTLKGILDWQQHLQEPLLDQDYSYDNTCNFVYLVLDMEKCLYVSSMNPFSRGKITTQLQSTSAKFKSRVRDICTPLAILRSVEILSGFAYNRNYNPWYHQTSRFLVDTAAEAFQDSHPSLLLLHLLFSGPTASQLAMLCELGSDIMQRFYGEAEAFWFRVAIHIVVSSAGLDAAIGFHADELCATTETDARRWYEVAKLYQSMGQYEKSEDAVRRCMAQLEVEGDANGSKLIAALQFLAGVQSKQNDLAGQELTLQEILEVTLARDWDELHTSQLSVDALEAVSDLEVFYARHGLNEQRDALHLEYPSAFEL